MARDPDALVDDAVDKGLIGHKVGRYRIARLLGKGGMGRVYEARDEDLRRPVALKLLPASVADNEERRQRFLREARSAAAVTHPNVAVVYEVGESEGRVYIAMELIGGRSLRELLAHPLAVAEALRIANSVALGLAAAHESGVVHRDLKPENVMVTSKGDVKILDFGLAKLHEAGSLTVLGEAKTEQQITEEGRVLGTPAYMSPEQARGETVDARSDVFSFGVVLYEMVAGVRPFRGTTAVAILLAVTTKEPEPLSRVNPDVTPEISSTVARCLEKLAEARYANGQELVDALAGVPVEPRVSRPSSQRKGSSVPTVSLLTPEAATVAPRGKARWRWGLVALVGLAATGLSVGYRVRTTSLSLKTAPSTSPAASDGDRTAPSPSPALRARRLTGLTRGSLTFDAFLSPDGSQLAYIDSDGVWVQDVAGGERKRLGTPLEQKQGSLSSAPDGKGWLVAETHLWLAPFDGGPAHQLPDPPWLHTCSPQENCTVHVSPDGLRVALRHDRAIDIEAFDGTTPGKTWPTLSNGPLVFSPDGKHVAYLEFSLAGATVMVASVDGTASTRLLEAPARSITGAGGGALAWPDSHRILLGARDESEGTCALREIAVDDDGRLAAPARDLWVTRGDSLVNLTAAGGHVAVAIQDSQYQVFVATVNSDGSVVGPPKQLTTSRSSYAPRWLSNQRVAFASLRNAGTAIYAQGLDDAEARLLVAPPLIAQASPLKETLRTGELVYARPTNPDGGLEARLFGSIPGRSEHAFELLTNQADSFALRCAAGDPSSCVTMEGNRMLDVSRVDLVTGRKEPRFARMECEYGNGLAVAPDDKTVAVTCGDDRIRFATVAGGPVRTLAITPPLLPTLQGVAFAPNGHSLLVTGMNEPINYAAMLAVGPDGHARVVMSSNRRWFSAPIVSPDGKMLAWHEMRFESELWVLDSP
jgi:serine/threonine protein kinase